MDVAAKLEPPTVRVKLGEPGAIDWGDKAVTAGARMVKVKGVELPTATVALPAEFSSAGVTVAVSCVGLTNAVESGLPFHRTVLPLENPVPLTRRLREVVPAGAEFGLRETRLTGFGLSLAMNPSSAPPP
jgi:hypothetical protein